MTSENDMSTEPSFWQAGMIHLIFFGMALVVLSLSFFLQSDGSQSVFLPGFQSAIPETCGAKALFGISCPGCGLTRSFISISGGRWRDAWNLNPASFLLYVFVAIQIPWQLYQLWRIRLGKSEYDSMWTFAPLLVCSLGLVAQWIYKLSMGILVT